MTRQDIIRMARKAGLHRQQHNLMSNPVQYRFSYDGYEENLEDFAILVAQRVLAGSYPEMIALVRADAKAEEREACAKVCDEAVAELIASECNKDLFEVAVGLRDAIRARGVASIRGENK